jgi:ribonuclease P protein component
VPGNEKFSHRERLTRRLDYLDLYEHGEKVVGRYFVLHTVRRDGQGRKFGIAVSRKVGNAVVRNRVKRYLREIYRTHRAELDDNLHLVIVARPVSARLDFHEAQDAVRQLFQRGGVRRG